MPRTDNNDSSLFSTTLCKVVSTLILCWTKKHQFLQSGSLFSPDKTLLTRRFTLLYAIATLRRATPRYAALRRATPRYSALRRATPRYAALRCATLCYAVLRCATLCYAVLRYIFCSQRSINIQSNRQVYTCLERQ
jgi:hypothetical protein